MFMMLMSDMGMGRVPGGIVTRIPKFVSATSRCFRIEPSRMVMALVCASVLKPVITNLVPSSP